LSTSHLLSDGKAKGMPKELESEEMECGCGSRGKACLWEARMGLANIVQWTEAQDLKNMSTISKKQ
jgi:hypothetical protein